MEDKDCGICGDSDTQEVDKEEYGYKYLCSKCKMCNEPDEPRNFFNF